MGALLQRECERWDAVIEHRAAHLEAGFAQQQTVLAYGVRLAGARKAAPPGKRCGRQSSVRFDFGHAEDRAAVLAGNQVPGIGLQLVLDGVDHPRGSVDAYRLVAAE